MRQHYTFIIFFVLMSLLAQALKAQTTNVDIGAGTSTTDNSPIQRFYDYSASELLYLSSEINTSGNITGLGFYKSSGATTVTIDSVYIYLKENTATALTVSGSLTGYTLVYAGSFPNTLASGWSTINFNAVSSFVHNNATNNLSVMIVRPYQALTSSRPYWRYTDNMGSRNAWYRSSTAAWSGTMNEVSTWRPNIRLTFTAACSGIPTAGTTNATATTLACNATTTLSLTGNTNSMGISYQWQYNTTGTWQNFGTNAATQTTPAVIQTTQFRCVVTCTSAGGGSSNSTPVTVTTSSTPINIGNDTTICPGISYTLNAGNPGSIYLWSTGATTQSININAVGTYTVAVTLANGCKGYDTLLIAPGITPINNLAAITNLCEGDNIDLNAGNTGSSFVWQPSGATTQTINVTTGGNYSVQVKSIHGCIINSATNVMVRPLPVAHLAADTSICSGNHITLDAGNTGYNFLWNTGAITQSITATDSGLYHVKITTPYSCVLIDSLHIAFLPAAYVEGFNFIPLFFDELGKVQFAPLNPVNTTSYLWDFGDGSPTSTLMNPTKTYAVGGSYNVTLTVSNSCGSYQVSLPINVDIVTGIVTIGSDAAQVELYPNPANDYITIIHKGNLLKMQQVTVFDMLGKMVYQSNSDSDKEHKLSVVNMASGIYSVRILSDKGFIIRKFQVLK